MEESAKGTYLTPQEAAARKGVAVASIYKAIERGQISAHRVLNRVALKAADVDAYQPGSYGENKRTHRVRGPGRPSTASPDAKEETSEE